MKTVEIFILVQKKYFCLGGDRVYDPEGWDLRSKGAEGGTEQRSKYERIPVSTPNPLADSHQCCIHLPLDCTVAQLMILTLFC